MLVGLNRSSAPVQVLFDYVPSLETVDGFAIEGDRFLAYERLSRVALEQQKRYDIERRGGKEYILGDHVFIPKTNARSNQNVGWRMV